VTWLFERDDGYADCGLQTGGQRTTCADSPQMYNSWNRQWCYLGDGGDGASIRRFRYAIKPIALAFPLGVYVFMTVVLQWLFYLWHSTLRYIYITGLIATNFLHVLHVSACGLSPCKNGGTCDDHFYDGTYTCHCPLQYTGRNCEKSESMLLYMVSCANYRLTLLLVRIDYLTL